MPMACRALDLGVVCPLTMPHHEHETSDFTDDSPISRVAGKANPELRQGSKGSVASAASTAVTSDRPSSPGLEASDDDSSSDEDDVWTAYVPPEQQAVSEALSEAYGVPSPRLPPVPRTPERELLRKRAMGKMSELAAKCRRRKGSKQRLAADTIPEPRAEASTTAASSLPAGVEGEQNAIILDWDDTLLPTWYLKSVVEPCTPGARGAAIPSDSPFYEPMRRHGETIAEVLRAARAVGRVAIVTLSMRPWVHSSAAQFLPGLDLQELLEELDIKIYYAFEHVHPRLMRVARRRDIAVDLIEDGTDVLAACKRAAMKKALRDLRGKDASLRHNVLSIGDSCIEQNAMKDVLWHERPHEPLERQSLCKTMKLLEESSLQGLGEQLHILRAWLPTMMAHRQDFDLSMDEADGDDFSQVSAAPLVSR